MLPPDPAAIPTETRARERRAIAALAIAAFALNLNTNVLGALLPFLPRESLSGEHGGTYLVAAAGFGSAIGALQVGWLTRRCGQRRVLIGGLVAFVLLSGLHLTTPAFVALLVLRAVSGLAVGVAYAAASVLAVEVSPYSRRGAAMGVFTAGMFLAIPVGLPLSVWLASLGHWSWIFGVQAGIAALGAFWALRAVPDVRRDEPPVSMFRQLATPGVGAVLLATALHVGSFFTTVQLATTWLDQTGRVAKEDQMLLWVGLGLASVLGSAVLSRLSDRFGKRNFVLLTSAILVACFALLAREPAAISMLGIGSLLAITAAARTGPLQALLSGLAPAGQWSALMGLRGFVMQAGVGTFAIGSAVIASNLGFRGVLLLAGGCQLLSYVAIRVGVRNRKKNDDAGD